MTAQPKRKRPYIPTGNPRGRPRRAAQPAPVSIAPPPVLLAEPPSQPLAYRIPAAAKAVGISASKMKRLVGQGEIRSIVRGRMRIIPADALREWAGMQS
jgi:excisionase family DNA binding protein